MVWVAQIMFVNLHYKPIYRKWESLNPIGLWLGLPTADEREDGLRSDSAKIRRQL